MKTIKLKSPIIKGEVQIDELTFTEPKVRHMLALDAHSSKESYGADLALASALTGQSETLLQEMGPEDWIEVRTVLSLAYGRFMGLTEEEVQEVMASPQ